MFQELKLMAMQICIELKIKIEIKVIFLFSTTQEQLDYLRFPLGEIDKSETRLIAEKLN